MPTYVLPILVGKFKKDERMDNTFCSTEEEEEEPVITLDDEDGEMEEEGEEEDARGVRRSARTRKDHEV